MDLSGHLLLIVSRDTLLQAESTPQGTRIFRLIAKLTRKGHHVLLTAAEPDHWLPTRGSVDNALVDQGRLQKEIHEAGGDLDGVYYVPRSLFTQDRNREGALKDILERYTAPVDNTLLISSSVPFLRAAKRLSIATEKIPQGPEGIEALEFKLKGISE